MTKRILLLPAALGLAVLTAPAFVESYPWWPTTPVVPFLAGGPADTTSRIVADKMKDVLGPPDHR